MNKSKKGLAIAISVFGIISAIVPLTVYNFVEMADSGMHSMEAMSMACVTSCVTATVIGAAVTLIAIASLFIKNTKVNLINSLLLAAGGVSIIAAPLALGLCKSKDMACRYITQPTLGILGGAITALALIRLVTGILNARKSATQL